MYNKNTILYLVALVLFNTQCFSTDNEIDKEQDNKTFNFKQVNNYEIEKDLNSITSRKSLIEEKSQATETIGLHQFLLKKPGGLLFLAAIYRQPFKNKQLISSILEIGQESVKEHTETANRPLNATQNDDLMKIYNLSFQAQMRDYQFIPRIYAFDDMDAILHHAFVSFDEEDMVACDVDNTLIWFLDPFNVVHAVNKTPLHSKFLSLEDNVRERFYHWFDITAPCCPVEPQTPQLLSNLQARKIKIIALTAMRPLKHKALELEKDRPKWRINHLKKLSFDFSGAFPIATLGWLLNTENNAHFPEPYFEDGILFSGLAKKPDTLIRFLQIMSFKPKAILFIDDSLANVISVYNELTRVGIKCYSILYTRAERFSANPMDNVVLANEFHSYLKKQEEYIDELAANPWPLPEDLHL